MIRVAPNQEHYSGRVAARVRELRLKRGLTCVQLARELGLSCQTVYSWEYSTRGIPADTYPRLANALGVSIRTLLPKE